VDILNFISWIRGGRYFTTVDPATSLLPVGVKDPKRDDGYLTGAITVDNFAQIVGPYATAGAQGPMGPQGVPGPVGPAGLNWQGAWVSGTSYVTDDAVGYGGASYFCINATSGTLEPNLDTANWALLASQGAIGPQGPQGIQGPAGPSGSGLPGIQLYQMQYWDTATTQWTPGYAIYNNGVGASGARVGIGTTPDTNYSLSIRSGFAAFRAYTTTVGNGIANLFQTTAAAFQWGLNPPSGNPVFNNSFYFTMNQAFPIKFATNFSGGGGDRLIIQGNGQVTVGAAQATNTTANLVVKQNDIEVEEVGKGVILASPNGTRYRITVTDGGAIIATAV